MSEKNFLSSIKKDALEHVSTTESWISRSNVVHTLESSIAKQEYTRAIGIFRDAQSAFEDEMLSQDDMAQVDALARGLVRNLECTLEEMIQQPSVSHMFNAKIAHLVELEEVHIACSLCLESFTVKINQAIGTVARSGKPAEFMVDLAGHFFTILLVCVEDFQSLYVDVHEVRFLMM